MNNELVSCFTASAHMDVYFPEEFFGESMCKYLELDIISLNSYSARLRLLRDDEWDDKTIILCKTGQTAIFVIPVDNQAFAVNVQEKDITENYPDLAEALDIDEESSFAYLLILRDLCNLMESGICISDKRVYEYAVCTSSEGTAPPEEIGGPAEFKSFMEANKDVSYPELPQLEKRNAWPWSKTPDIRSINMRIRC